MLAALQQIVGEDHTMAPAPHDAIDGVLPAFVIRPGNVGELSAVLQAVRAARAAVVVRGAGTKLGWGQPPDSLPAIVDMTRFNRVLEHAAGDLVVRAEAGVRLQDLQRTLATAGQRLALDPPHDGTLGGIVASNASGPRRLRFGTCRDLLIGITVVLADGTVAKAGGKVVKNVAGYDLAKLFTGSFGTLGAIAEVIFRLHPQPADRSIVIADVPTLGEAAEGVQVLMHSSLVPSAIELRGAGPEAGTVGGEARQKAGTTASNELEDPSVLSGFSLAALFEGVTAGVIAQADKAAALLRPHGRVTVAHGADADVLWAPYAAEPFADATVGLKLSVVPTDVASACAAVFDLARSRSIGASIQAHAASGIVYAAFEGAHSHDHAHVIAELRRRGPVAVLKSPAAMKRVVPVWPDAGDAYQLMQRVKRQFDADRVMAPGRFMSGI